jgi:hypothetical protein
MKLRACCTLEPERPTHVATLRRCSRVANERRMAVVVPRTFLEQVLPAAPDVPIQLARTTRCAGRILGPRDGPLTLPAALAAAHPATKHPCFDVAASVVRFTSPAALDTLARRMRTIGRHRVLSGSQLPAGPVLDTRRSVRARSEAQAHLQRIRHVSIDRPGSAAQRGRRSPLHRTGGAAS